ncbi:MAG: phosphoribosylformylglycinamidine synthase, partial [Actinomycetota bacterium]
MLYRFYRSINTNFEYCFYIEANKDLEERDYNTLKWLLAETFQPDKFSKNSFLDRKNNNIVEIGPRLNFETAYSTNAVAICHSCGLDKVTRLERSRRYLLSPDTDTGHFIESHHDRMTECVYPKPLTTFETGINPEPVYEVPLMEKGMQALKEVNQQLGLGLDSWDLDFYFDLFVNKINRNPTNVECFQLSQANSEHSRHWFFKGKLVIDGKKMPETLLELIKQPLKDNPANSLIAFSDNSGAIKGFDLNTIICQKPGYCSPFKNQGVTYNPIFTAETHNFPSGIAPFPGAETGTGGRIRDVQATGRGGLVVAGTAGYCTGNLNIDGYSIPGEDRSFGYPPNLASPLDIMIKESNGASDYGNKFGEPVIQGFARTFGLKLAGGERREWVKPIMFTGGVGQIDGRHLEKEKPAKGMLILQIGGPAYRIGMGGGSASSLIQEEGRQELDFNAVQRGNAQMEQKLNRVIRACIEMGKDNPILSIHDQGAGGPCNVLTEIVEPAGGRIEIRNIQVGDKTMSVLEIWGGEYQERNAFLIHPKDLKLIQSLCQREKVNCEVLGGITGDGRIVVNDRENNSTPVNLDLDQILSNIPQKVFHFNRVKKETKTLSIPSGLDLKKAIQDIFKLPSVCSKGYLVRKVDRSVTGLISRQQCCGPLQLPVSDVAVVAQSHFCLTGTAISIGEQPLKTLAHPAAGARMSLGEALTNMVWARITGFEDIKCSVNWMWPAKLPGEGPAIYDAAKAISQAMSRLQIAADGGKDSVSMAANVGKETVKAPNEVVISCYGPVEDITRVITPDIKRAGESKILIIDISGGKRRLGGSAFAQSLGQLGDMVPDLENPETLKSAFEAIQEFIGKNLILSGHDISDGGLVTTLAEMIMPANCGAEISLKKGSSLEKELFAEELGMVIEYLPQNEEQITGLLKKQNIPYSILGQTTEKKSLAINYGGKKSLEIETPTLLQWWEQTSDRLEQEQMNPAHAHEQEKSHNRPGPAYRLSFKPQPTDLNIMKGGNKPRVAIIREEGSNGDREMASAFHAAGFESWDVTITDIANGDVSLDKFKGAAFVGGFSYADVLDSAKGWAGVIKFNPRLREAFDRFYLRDDTFSLGVCNGCQLMALLGWVPWKGIPEEKQPRFISNPSGRFESRWVSVKILNSPSVMLKGMEGSILGIWVAHGEGHLYCPDKNMLEDCRKKSLTPMAYVEDNGTLTEKYPYNPNSSPGGITALCSPDGRHLAMMPHPERTFLTWQWPWMPNELKEKLSASPWLKMFQN